MDNVAGDRFGASVAISGDTIVVGAPSAEIGGKDVQGAAYVFVKPPTGWAGGLTQTARLLEQPLPRPRLFLPIVLRRS